MNWWKSYIFCIFTPPPFSVLASETYQFLMAVKPQFRYLNRQKWAKRNLHFFHTFAICLWVFIGKIHSFSHFSLGFPRSKSTFSPYVPRFSEAKSHPHPFPVAQIAEAPQCRCSWPLASMLVWMSAGSVASAGNKWCEIIPNKYYPLVI